MPARALRIFSMRSTTSATRAGQSTIATATSSARTESNRAPRPSKHRSQWLRAPGPVPISLPNHLRVVSFIKRPLFPPARNPLMFTWANVGLNVATALALEVVEHNCQGDGLSTHRSSHFCWGSSQPAFGFCCANHTVPLGDVAEKKGC